MVAAFNLVSRFEMPKPGGVAPYISKLASPNDFSSMAAATSAHSIVIFDPATMKPVRELCGHKEAIYDLEFFRGSSQGMLSCAGDGTARVWDVRAANPLARTLECAPSGSNAAGETFSASVGSHDTMAAVGVSEKVHIFDIGTGKRPCIYTDVHTDVINFIRFHPTDSDCFVSAADDNLICVADTRIQDDEDTLRCVLNNEDNVRFFSFVGPDRTWLVTSSMTETLRIWNLHSTENEVNGQRLAEFTDVRDHPILQHDGSWGYTIDVFYDTRQQRMLTLGGSCNGQLALLNTSAEGVSVAATFEGGCHSDVVRSGICMGNNVFFTGGEDGVLCSWKGEDTVQLESNSYAPPSKKKTRKVVSPY